MDLILAVSEEADLRFISNFDAFPFYSTDYGQIRNQPCRGHTSFFPFLGFHRPISDQVCHHPCYPNSNHIAYFIASTSHLLNELRKISKEQKQGSKMTTK